MRILTTRAFRTQMASSAFQVPSSIPGAARSEEMPCTSRDATHFALLQPGKWRSPKQWSTKVQIRLVLWPSGEGERGEEGRGGVRWEVTAGSPRVRQERIYFTTCKAGGQHAATCATIAWRTLPTVAKNDGRPTERQLRPSHGVGGRSPPCEACMMLMYFA